MKVQAFRLFALLAFSSLGSGVYAGKAPVAPANPRSVHGLEASVTDPGVVNPPPLGGIVVPPPVGVVNPPPLGGIVAQPPVGVVTSSGPSDFSMWPGGFIANPLYAMYVFILAPEEDPDKKGGDRDFKDVVKQDFKNVVDRDKPVVVPDFK
jgi:hypothetical protein